MRFLHEATASRVVFGAGRVVEASDEIRRLGQRSLLIADGAASLLAPDQWADLNDLAVATIDRVRQHVPVESAEAARELAREHGADSLLALGGGSTVGLAKAVALTERIPILAVPSTYAGSEMTPVWGLTEGGVKMTGRDPGVAPATVIYDPELTYSLPAATTAASGLNALAHCADALWAPGRDPLTDTMAERGIASLAEGLPGAVAAGADPQARELCLVGAWLAGATFAAAGSSLHHKLCHVLGGRFDLPHAETHAIVLPWATALAVDHVPEAGEVLARALGAPDPVEGLRDLAARLGAPSRLEQLGLTPEQALEVADEVPLDALATQFPISREELRRLLSEAAVGCAT